MYDSTDIYQALFETSAIGVSLNNSDGVRIDVNKAFCRMLGYTREELVGTKVVDVTHPEEKSDSQRIGRDWRAGTLQMGRSFERRFVHKNGSTVWALCNLCWTKDADEGKLALLQYTDITERKQAEDALLASERQRQLSEERFRDYAMSGSDIFWELDDKLRFSYLSAASDQDILIRQKDFIGSTRWDVMGADPDIDPVWRRHKEDLLARRPFRDFRYSPPQGFGNAKHFSISGRPIYTADGAFAGYRGTSTDISKRHELNRMKDEFLSITSHELRTPLTSIYGSLKLLSGNSEQVDPDTASNLIDIATKNSERLIALVNDILDMEKISAGKMAYHYETLNLNDLVQEVLALNRSFADEFGITLELTVGEEAPFVTADAARLSQVLTNLVSNAVKFSPKGQTVSITTSVEDSLIVCRVTDRGRGIPENFRDLVFDKFVQADGSDKRLAGGTGLGLSICKAIIEEHGGSIGFTSRVGQGTQFYFKLPTVQLGTRHATPAA